MGASGCVLGVVATEDAEKGRAGLESCSQSHRLVRFDHGGRLGRGRLHALDTTLDVAGGASKQDVLAAAGDAEWVGAVLGSCPSSPTALPCRSLVNQ
jgi:hypothetical protein